MTKLKGKSVYQSVAVGPILRWNKQEIEITDEKITDAEAEIVRVKEPIEQAKAQLGKLYDKAVVEVGEESAAIFEVHQMMLEDDDYLDTIFNMIREECRNAVYAVEAAGNQFSAIFAAMDDDYMRARSADIKDISNRVVRILAGEEDVDLTNMAPSIIVADDLSPSETVQLDKSKILAFVTVQGSTNSHTAILARMMNIPALVNVPMDLNKLHTGMNAIVDGILGEVAFEPTEEEMNTAKSRVEEEKEKLRVLSYMKGQATVSKSGKRINLYANIGNVDDVSSVLENDAEGIGLY